MAQRCIPHKSEIQHEIPKIMHMESQAPEGPAQTYSERPCNGHSSTPNVSGTGPHFSSDNGGSSGDWARGKRRRTAADPPVDTGAAVEAGAALPAGFAGLPCVGSFGSALAAGPTAGWAEPVRQLYTILDYVAMQEAMAYGRLATVRVHWINRPPALAHLGVEVLTVPLECTVGYLKRLICKASGGVLWPRTIQPMRHGPNQDPPGPSLHEGAGCVSAPTQGTSLESAAATLRPSTAAERPFAFNTPQGVAAPSPDGATAAHGILALGIPAGYSGGAAFNQNRVARSSLLVQENGGPSGRGADADADGDGDGRGGGVDASGGNGSNGCGGGGRGTE
ncbi:hypothetical protein Vretimale_18876, partial [Volvox reticuliferus]